MVNPGMAADADRGWRKRWKRGESKRNKGNKQSASHGQRGRATLRDLRRRLR